MLKWYVQQDLARQCQQGNPKAQKMVYERYAAKMLSLCLRYVPRDDEAEDLMIGGFLKVFQKIAQFKGEGSFEGWIRRIMVNECLNHLRKQRWLYATSDLPPAPEMSQTIAHDYGAEELLALVQDLPTGYRTVFNLYAIEGYSHKEIAEQLGINENTSKSQLARARALLQKKLQQHQDKLNQVKHG
ncbi:MAG: sigma-70 family RNA polymerase sigma factor [Microscillaceae bacterium]|nr:sigma-70 family RNA polymerase sigma factor [Microscillaceae bacterium]